MLERQNGPAGFAPGVDTDTRALRNAFATFATGVTVATTIGADGRPAGITVNAFTSVSLDPPLILISVAKANRSFPAFQTCRSFTVNVLSAEQQDISQRFARPGADKWHDTAFRRGVLDCPVLADALSIFECALERYTEAGDHAILLGRIVGFDHRGDGEPLIFYRGGYQRLKPNGRESA